MSRSVEELHRFGIKIFFEPGTAPDPSLCIPIFHRWIRERALGDVLIDVADYTHLADGPSVLLVGHDGNLAFDGFDQRAGLFYTRKRPSSDPFRTRVVNAARMLFSACQLLENDSTLGKPARFVGNELQFVSNDRLAAPLDDATASELGGHLEPVVSTWYADTQHEITSLSQGKDRLRLSLKAAADVSVKTLLARTT